MVEAEATDSLEGHFLIAMPSMADSRFEHSVIYLCSHSEQGAMGLVVNQIAQHLSLEELLIQLDIVNDENPIRLPEQVRDIDVEAHWAASAHAAADVNCASCHAPKAETEEEIAAAAEGFLAQYERIETPDSLAEYTMDHTSLLYLMDENWQLKTFFAEADASPDYIAQCLAQHLG